MVYLYSFSLYGHHDSADIRDGPRPSLAGNQKTVQKKKCDLGGQLQQTRLEIDEKWFAVGLSPKKESEELSSFQGFHNKHVLILFDEGPLCPLDRWKAARTMLTSARTKFIAIGNPTSPQGPFKEACENPLFTHIKWSCFDSPNLRVNKIRNIHDIRREARRLEGMTDEQQKRRLNSYHVIQPELLTLEWVMETWIEEGEESPYVQSRILGNFPKESPDSIISYTQVETCMHLELSKDGPAIIGVDCARFGQDNTVITVMKGEVEIDKRGISKRDTVYVADQVAELTKEHFVQMAGVDDIGLGGGVTDNLNRLTRDGDLSLKVIPFIASESPIDTDKYVNMRDEAFWELVKDMKKERIQILKDKKILSQLPAIRYRYKDARIKIEPSEDIKKRIKRSPDDSVSLAICNWIRNHGGAYDIGGDDPGIVDFSEE